MEDDTKQLVEQQPESAPKPKLMRFPDGSHQVSYSDVDVRRWEASGQLPTHLAEHFFSSLAKSQKKFQDWNALKEQYLDATMEELAALLGLPRTLSQEESQQSIEEMKLQIQFQDFLLNNWDELNAVAQADEEEEHSLYDGVDLDNQFGISRVITDAVYHLEALLNNLKVNHICENQYEARGSTVNSKEETISLVYSFTAASTEEADAIALQYKKTMLTKGVKLWMAHWRKANKMGRVEYGCQMIDIMKLLSEDDRDAFFSVKEKQEHWAITKMLSMTKIAREKHIKKRGKGTVLRWIEQALVEILGGEKDEDANDKYPNTILVRVLIPTQRAFTPALYANRTLTLNPQDALLAFKIQTRANQMGRGSRTLHLDWDYLFEAGNLQTTAFSNKRMAKAQTRKKMDRFKENEVIEDWNEELMGLAVQPKPQKKRARKSNS